MTVLAITYVPEGIAMATDSRLTGHFYRSNNNIDNYTISDNQQKLHLIRNNSIGLCFKGDTHKADKDLCNLISEFDEGLNATDNISTVAKNLLEFFKLQPVKFETVFYLAGYDGKEPYVYSINTLTEKIKRTNINENKKQINGIVCDGDVSVDVAGFMLNKGSFNFELMPLGDAVFFSEFIVRTIIDYEKLQEKLASCGGPIDVLIITKNKTKFLKHKLMTI